MPNIITSTSDGGEITFTLKFPPGLQLHYNKSLLERIEEYMEYVQIYTEEGDGEEEFEKGIYYLGQAIKCSLQLIKRRHCE